VGIPISTEEKGGEREERKGQYIHPNWTKTKKNEKREE
jgi:hypothetical protein